MIGSGVLMLPVVAINAGYIMIPIIVVGVGLLTFYTARVLLLHQNKHRTVRDMVKQHFESHGWVVFIDIAMGISVVGGISSYFPLFVRQITGIFPKL